MSCDGEEGGVWNSEVERVWRRGVAGRMEEVCRMEEAGRMEEVGRVGVPSRALATSLPSFTSRARSLRRWVFALALQALSLALLTWAST